jgi:hypothetical protein
MVEAMAALAEVVEATVTVLVNLVMQTQVVVVEQVEQAAADKLAEQVVQDL